MTKMADMMGIGFSWPQALALGDNSVAITAAGTSSAANAAACDAQNTIFLVTSGASTAGVRMSANAPLLSPIVVSVGANGAVVYPHTGGTVNGGSTDAGETLAATTVQIWYRVSATAWIALIGA